RETPASFEPTIDYVVVKIPRFAFEKFRGVDTTLTTQMKSVGEVMAIGRTFKQALQKAMRGLETGRSGFDPMLTGEALTESQREELERRLRVPGPDRLFWIGEAFRRGMPLEELHRLTHVDPWFLREVKGILSAEEELAKIRRDSLQLEDVDKAQFIAEARTSARHAGMPADEVAAMADEYGRMIDRAQKGLLPEDMRHYKRLGFSDRRLAALLGKTEQQIRERREAFGIRPVYKRVDTCAAEFEAHTPYMYSSYEEEDEAQPTGRQKVMILGGGPNRIGQGIEFDYCCVHAAFALREAGYETIMVNCNPETVSTDWDTSDRLYFEPLTLEDVMAIATLEKPVGAIVQFGGQTPLKLAVPLEKAGLPILGTTPEAIDRAEDRERFAALIEKLGLRQPENGMARSPEQAFEVARRIGYPVMVRPSYVLGGRAMQTVYDDAELAAYMEEAVHASPEHPVLIDRFLRDAAEVDVDLVADRTGRVVIGGVMEHIEEAGVHSGDAACALPPFTLGPAVVEQMKEWSRAMAKELGVVGLMNVQFAVQNGTDVYVLEVNPRASRTVPFVSKATGVPLAKLASLCMVGKTLEELGFTQEVVPTHVSVKEAVFPFTKFAGADTILGPEMKSTGEVMGIDPDFHLAFAKSQIAAGNHLPRKPGRVFIS
ncbi:MAG: carbamoyl-phosphate synthase large subunit, partial [Myxococcales bacterium]